MSNACHSVFRTELGSNAPMYSVQPIRNSVPGGAPIYSVQAWSAHSCRLEKQRISVHAVPAHGDSNVVSASAHCSVASTVYRSLNSLVLVAYLEAAQHETLLKPWSPPQPISNACNFFQRCYAAPRYNPRERKLPHIQPKRSISGSKLEKESKRKSAQCCGTILSGQVLRRR